MTCYSIRTSIFRYICLIIWEGSYFLFKLSYFYTQKQRHQVQWSTFHRTLKNQQTGTRRCQVQCQSIKVSQRVIDLLWKYDINLSCKWRLSRKPWEPWNESSGPWKPSVSYDTLPRTLKTQKYVFFWLSVESL